MKSMLASTLLLLCLSGSDAVLFNKWLTDENNCDLVSSRGILFSCDVHPIMQQSDTNMLKFSEFVEGEAWKTSKSVVASATASLHSLGMAHYPQDIAKQGDGVVVYVVTTALPAFVHQVLPGIKHKFKLVTGDSDKGPIEVLGPSGFSSLASNEHLIKWFAQNAADGEVSEKLVRMPIGLDYHTLKAGSHPWGPQATPKAQEAMLLGKSKAAPSFEERTHKGYYVGSMSSPERRQAVASMRSSSFVDVQGPTSTRGAFWDECGKHQFVMSPMGNGVDCHRTWEALAMGSIPVVSDRLLPLYEQNNINVVALRDSEWGQLGSASVQGKIKAAAARHKDGIPEAMYLKYWMDKIRA
eukprot:TRINITY_DN76743_c0_g1_i1.p1 TRINITY_DN76743_c0_g1~~TRINITY_DN76743_c0_g1_i1.p1  ORF type:complete len:354 (-),score=71.51 TRINITY_DN76743_c0_g1_i1:121-1182(-)